VRPRHDRTWHGANRWPAFLANALRAAFRIVRSSSLRVHLCSTGRALHRRAPPPSRIGVLCVARTDGAILIPMVNSIWAPGSAYALYFSSAIRCPYCSRDLEVGRPISRCSTVRTPWGAAGECVRCRNFRPCGTVSPTLLPCMHKCLVMDLCSQFDDIGAGRECRWRNLLSTRPEAEGSKPCFRKGRLPPTAPNIDE